MTPVKALHIVFSLTRSRSSNDTEGSIDIFVIFTELHSVTKIHCKFFSLLWRTLFATTTSGQRCGATLCPSSTEIRGAWATQFY